MRRVLLPLLAISIFGSTLPRAKAQAATWKDVQIPTLHKFQPQQPRRVELPNGMVLLLQEDHELPTIDGFARIRGGSREEPAQKIGLVETLADSWRTGGTKSKTGDELDDFLEARAAKVETGAMLDSANVSFSCLKADFDDVFAIFVDVLRNPEFRQDKLDLSKDSTRTDISRRNDDASGIAQRESTKLGYGAQNPYAREAEYATIDAITRQDLLNWHKSHVYPNNILLGIVGDFDSAALEAKIRKALGSDKDWAKGPAAVAPKIDFQPAKPGYFLVDKKDVNQSNIYMVELGTKRNNPDYYAITVFNEAFGGGFSSRLFGSIRSKKGLAYGVGGGVGTSFDHDGLVRIVMGTKSSTTIEAIQALDDEIDGLTKNPLTDDEIRRAKDSILNSFVFNFDSPSKVLREQMAYAFYGYPSDYLERYRAGIEKVTPADVARAAAKYLHKDQLAVLVVGNSAEFDKPLSSMGTVTNVDITIPEPAGAKSDDKTGDKPADAPTEPTASNPEGKALAAKAAAAIGTPEKLKSIHSLESTFTLTQKTPQGDMKMSAVATIVFPDHMHVELTAPDGPVTIVVTPDFGFMAAAQGAQDMPESRNRESLEQIKRDPIYLAQHIDDPAFIFAAGATEKIGPTETRIVNVSGPGVAIRWFVDPATGHILRETYKTNGPHGPSEGVTDLSNWETTDGITLPKLHTNQMNGQASSSAEFTAVKFNPTVDPKLFQKPASDPKPAQ